MKLWSSEHEAMRAEARRVVDDAMARRASVQPSGDDAKRSLDDVVRDERDAVARLYEPHPQADERLLGGVWCRVFMPPGRVEAVYLHFHGGGMVLGAPEMNDAANQALSVRFDLAVVSVDYRLAPEHSYPDAPDDGFAVAQWLLEHAEAELGSARLIVGGEDVGAYLALAVLLRLRDHVGRLDHLLGANLVAGWFDWGGSPSSRGTRVDDGADHLSPEQLRRYADAYLPQMTDEARRRPDISPVFGDLRGLCPALLSVGTRDHLLDDTLLLASRWAEAGNEVELVVLPDMPHDFASFACGLTAAWTARTALWFATVLAR